MKKELKFLVFILIVLMLLTGCLNQKNETVELKNDNQEIVCSISKPSVNFTSNQKITFQIKNEKVDSIKMFYSFVFDDSFALTDSVLDELGSTIEASVKDQFENINTKKIDNGIEINIEPTLKEMFDYVGIEYNEDGANGVANIDADEIIEQFTKSGYDCK